MAEISAAGRCRHAANWLANAIQDVERAGFALGDQPPEFRSAVMLLSSKIGELEVKLRTREQELKGAGDGHVREACDAGADREAAGERGGPADDPRV